MNIVPIVSDTLRWDHLGASGNPWIRTPNLDRLAEQSVVFERVYTGSFPTIPHRTDMVTGKWVYPCISWTPLPEDETIVGELLTEAGYVTMLIADTPHLVRDGHRFDRGLTGWKWNRGNRDPFELFHLPDDPGQEHDLAPSVREQAQRLHALHLDLLTYAGVGGDVLALRNRLPPLP